MLGVFRAADRATDRLLAGTGIVAIGLMLLLAVFVTLNVFARNVLHINIRGLFDGCVYGLFIFTFFTAAYTLREGKHISVDFFTAYLSRRAQGILRICSHLLALIFVIIFGWQAGVWAGQLFQNNVETGALFPIPQGILVSIIAFGCFLLILQIIRILVHSIHAVLSYEVPSQTSSSRLRDNPWLYAVAFIIGAFIGVTLFIYVNPIASLVFLLLFLLFSGMPVFFALGFIGCFGLYFLLGPSALLQAPIKAYRAVSSFPLAALPLFMLGGLILEQGKVAESLFRFAEVWVGRYASALLVATIAAGLMCCALSGSSAACTAMIATVAMPVLLKRGYSKSVSSGAVGGSTIGTVVPPSTGYVVYSAMVGESVGQLFIASILPSVIIFGFYFLFVIIRGIVDKKSLFEQGQIPTQISERVSWRDKFVATKDAVWGLLTPGIVLGGIYAGIFTPTESAGILVVYAVIVCIATGTFSWRELMRVTLRSAVISSMVLCIIFAAYIIALVLSQLQVAASIITFIEEAGLGAAGLMGILTVLLLILGLFMDSPTLKVTTLPVFYAPAMAAGINSLWLGIFYQVLGEIALLTPPVGINLFIIKEVAGIPLSDVVRGNLPYIVMMLLALIIIYFFPELVTWLPSTMVK